MFTGIIEEIGTIGSISRGSRSIRLHINAHCVMEDLKPGDSVAVNGVCLTADDLSSSGFTADVMPETMQRTGLKTLSAGTAVNLERAMPANGRFGGHIVSGHIDDTGTIIHKTKDDNAIWLQITTTKKVLGYLIEKGSVTLDGVSLTIVDILADSFTVSVIPHTAANTTLLQKQTNDFVNIECDLLGKYIHKYLFPTAGNQASAAITEDFLLKNGF